jgi:hypothetical protein
MKTNISLTSLLIVLFLSLSAKSIACPVWKIGGIQVVNEAGEILHNATIFKYYNYNEIDSYALNKPRLFDYDSTKQDTTVFEIWTGGLRRWSDGKRPIPTYVIRANGYADVIINADIKFKQWDEYLKEPMPILKVVMYHHKFIQLDGEVLHYTKYEYLDEIKVQDTTYLKLSDYLKDIKNESDVQKAERLANASIKSYPNPVIDELFITVTDDLSKPFMAKVTDITGRLVLEQELTNAESTLNIEFEEAGIYIISVFNAEGDLKYAKKFFKS